MQTLLISQGKLTTSNSGLFLDFENITKTNPQVANLALRSKILIKKRELLFISYILHFS